MRFWAFIIDSILASFLLWPLLRFWGHTDYYYWRSWPWSWSESTFVFAHTDPLAELLNWVLPAVAVLLFWIARQATPGKMAIGARIVDADTGAKPTTPQFIGRYLATMSPSLHYAWALSGSGLMRASRAGTTSLQTPSSCVPGARGPVSNSRASRPHLPPR